MSKVTLTRVSIGDSARSCTIGDDVRQRSWWRPISLRRVPLATTIAISLALLGLVVISHHQENRYGAVFIAKTAAGLSDGQVFLFKYMPTILIVLFGMWISAIDLDIKRLEPFYQLSQRKRQTRPPLLCSYDTEFVLTVVFQSIRRSDFVVFGATILLILTTVIIPAVQNSMLLSRSQTISEDIRVTQGSGLVSPDTQVARMSYNVMATAYSMCWLGQNNPAYTTRDSSFAPFIHTLPPEDVVASSLEVPTTRYWAELNCWKPASIHVTANSTQTFGNQGFTVSFDDGRGCNTSNLLIVDNSVAFVYDADYEAYYFAAPSQGFASPGISIGQVCPQYPNLLLAVYRVRGLDFLRIPNFELNGNATAMFCESKYYSESVVATVTTNNYSILDYSATGPKAEMLDNVFNRTHFQYLLALGKAPLVNSQSNIDIGDRFRVSQTTRLKNISIAAPEAYSSPNMIGYLIGASQLPSSQYLSYDTLQDAYNKAYQLLFALAMSQNYQDHSQDTQKAVLRKVSEVVALVPGFAIATEVLFSLVVLSCWYLFTVIPARALYLLSNPDSLADTMVLARKATTQQAFENLSTAINYELRQNLYIKTFALTNEGESPPCLDCLNDKSCISVDSMDEIRKVPDVHLDHYPVEMTWTISGIVILTLAASIPTFIVLRNTSLRGDGLKVPSRFEFFNQLLLNFLPTVFASALGVYFSLLCRTLSFLKPLEVLRKGNASASAALQASCNSLPAPLVFVKALSGGHYILAALSIAAVLSNALTVALAGIFLRTDVTGSKSMVFHSLYKPFVIQAVNLDDVTSSTTLDSVYPVIANSTGATDLPSWTTHDYGHLPVSFETSFDDSLLASEFEYESIGYGAEFQCIDLLTPSTSATSSFQFRDQGQSFFLSTNFTTSGGDPCQCSLNFDESFMMSDHPDGFGAIYGSLSQDVSSLEFVRNYVSVGQNGNGSVKVQNQCDFCDRRIVYGWVRGHLVPTQSGSTNLTATGRLEYNATIIACTPRMKSQNMWLRIASNGRVLSYQGLGSPNYDLNPSINLTASFNTSINAMWNSVRVIDRTWHTDIIARDMPNYIFKKTQGNTGSFLDPQISQPSVEIASEFVSDTFARIFATQLFIDRPYLQTVNSSSHVTRDDSSMHNKRQASNTFDTGSGSGEIQGTMFFTVKHVFVSLPMFIISISILAFDLIVLLIFRSTLPAPFLPRMPFTIASQIAFFAGSRAVDDVVGVNGDLKKLDEKGYRYGFGRYISKNGTVCIGIEREGFVTKLRPDEGVRKTKGGEKKTDWKAVFRRRKIGDRRSYEDIDGQEFETLRRG